jgi:hypothetical protein
MQIREKMKLLIESRKKPANNKVLKSKIIKPTIAPIPAKIPITARALYLSPYPSADIALLLPPVFLKTIPRT